MSWRVAGHAGRRLASARSGDPPKGKTRLEAFSDGVLAIIITITAPETKVPHDPSLAALAPIVPVFLS